MLSKSEKELVCKNIGLARKTAKNLTRMFGRRASYSELYSHACFGLLQASQRYKADLHPDFKVYASKRIKGAVYDGLRKEGILPRSHLSKEEIWKRERKAEKCIPINSQNHAVDDIYFKPGTLLTQRTVSLSDMPGFEACDNDVIQKLERHLELKNRKAALTEAINSLPHKMRQLIKMYYFQNRTLKEAGEQLNLSKSWSARLHNKAIVLLSKKLVMEPAR